MDLLELALYKKIYGPFLLTPPTLMGKKNKENK